MLRESPSPCARARDTHSKKTRHVHACQQQQKPYCSQEQQERGANVFEECLFHPYHGHIPACQPGHLRINAARDGAQFGLRLDEVIVGFRRAMTPKS